MGSYIKIDRKILEWEWYRNEHTKNLFFHCLLKANWKDAKFEGKVIARGSFVTSVKRLSEELDLTSDEIKTALKHLIQTGEITKQTTNKYTVITVSNYDSYQELTKQIPNNSQTIAKPLPTIEEEKEIKNERKENRDGWDSQSVFSESRFNEFCELYPKKVKNILTVNGEYTYLLQTTPSLSEDDLIAAVKNYAEACRILKTNERYIKNPENWLKDSTWIDYLPENYKKPEGEKSKNKFNQFPQHDYDFEELERELLNN